MYSHNDFCDPMNGDPDRLKSAVRPSHEMIRNGRLHRKCRRPNYMEKYGLGSDRFRPPVYSTASGFSPFGISGMAAFPRN